MLERYRGLQVFIVKVIVVAVFIFSGGTPEAFAQSELDIRGGFSIKISRGRVLFKVGELANIGTSGVASGRIELSVWLSKQPYAGSGDPDGIRLAKCSVDGVVGGEAVANLSCSAKLRFIKRGKYYIIVTASELEAETGSYVVSDSFTFSKRFKW